MNLGMPFLSIALRQILGGQRDGLCVPAGSPRVAGARGLGLRGEWPVLSEPTYLQGLGVGAVYLNTQLPNGSFSVPRFQAGQGRRYPWQRRKTRERMVVLGRRRGTRPLTSASQRWPNQRPGTGLCLCQKGRVTGPLGRSFPNVRATAG